MDLIVKILFEPIRSDDITVEAPDAVVQAMNYFLPKERSYTFP